MKKLIASLSIAGLIACTGCNASPTGGRPATPSSGTSGSATHTASGKKESFKLKGPESTEKVEQGASKTFAVSISRDSNFKDNVTLKAEASDSKVHVKLDPPEFKASDKKDVEAALTADGDAPLGKGQVSITGTPESGSSTTLKVD
jgi:hypothetical protein